MVRKKETEKLTSQETRDRNRDRKTASNGKWTAKDRGRYRREIKISRVSINKAAYTATPVARGWAGAVQEKVTRAYK